MIGCFVGCVRPTAPAGEDPANGGGGNDAGAGGGGGGTAQGEINVAERLVAGCPVPLHLNPIALESGATWEVAGAPGPGSTPNIGTVTTQLGRPYFAPPPGIVGCALLRAHLASGTTLEKQVCFAPLPVIASPQIVSVRGRRALLPAGFDPAAFRFSINGLAAGNGDIGFVSAAGLYRAPQSFPTGVRLPLAITARVAMPACADVFATIDIVLVDVIATPGEISAMRVAGKAFDIEARAIYTSPVATAAGLALSENVTSLATTTWTPDKPAVANAAPGRITLGAEPGRATVRVTDTRFDPAPTDLVAVESRAAYELHVYARRGGDEVRVTDTAPLISVVRGERVPLTVYAVDTEGAAAGKLREASRDGLTFSGAVVNGVVAAPPPTAAVVEHYPLGALDDRGRPIARRLTAVFGYEAKTVAATVKNDEDNRETTFKMRAVELFASASVNRMMPPWANPTIPASFLAQKMLPSVSEAIVATAFNMEEGLFPSTSVDAYVGLPDDVCQAGLVDLSMFDGELFTVTVKTPMANPAGKSPVLFGDFAVIDTNLGWDRATTLVRDAELHGFACAMKGSLAIALLDNSGPVELSIRPSRRLAVIGDTPLLKTAFAATLTPRIPDGPEMMLTRPIPMHPSLVMATTTMPPDMTKSGYSLEVEITKGGQSRAPFLIAPASRTYFTANWAGPFTARARWVAKSELTRVTWKGAWGAESDSVEIPSDTPNNGCHAPSEPASGVVRPELTSEKLFSFLARRVNFETSQCENDTTTYNAFSCDVEPRPACCDSCPSFCGYYTGRTMSFLRFDDAQKPVVATWGDPFGMTDAGAPSGGYVRVVSETQSQVDGCGLAPLTPGYGFMPKVGTNKVTYEYVMITPGVRDNFTTWWDNPVIFETPSDAVFPMPNAVALPTPRALAPPADPRVAAKLAGKPAANVADIDLVFDDSLTTKPGAVNPVAKVTCADGGTPPGLAATFIPATTTERSRVHLTNLPAREADAGATTFDDTLTCNVKLDNGLTDIELRLFPSGIAERRREVSTDPQSGVPYEYKTRMPISALGTNIWQEGGSASSKRPIVPGTSLRANGKYVQALGPAMLASVEMEAIASRRLHINAADPGDANAPRISTRLEMFGFGPIVALESKLTEAASPDVRTLPVWDVQSLRTVVPVGAPPRILFANPTDLLAFDLGQKKFAAEPGYVFRAGRGPLYAASGSPPIRAAARGYVARTPAADGVEEVVVSDLSDLQPDFVPDLFSTSKDAEYLLLWQGNRLIDIQPFTAVAVVGAPGALRRSEVDPATGGAARGIQVVTSDAKIVGSVQAGTDIGYVVDPLLAWGNFFGTPFAPERDYPFLYWNETNYSAGRNPVNWVKAEPRVGRGSVSGPGHRFGFQSAAIVSDDDEGTGLMSAAPYDLTGQIITPNGLGSLEVVSAAGATSGGAVYGADDATSPFLGATVTAQTPGFNTPDRNAWDLDSRYRQQTHAGQSRVDQGWPAPLAAGLIVAGSNAYLRLITIPDNGQGEPLLTGDIKGTFTFLVHPMYVDQTHLETTARFDSKGFVLSFLADKGYDLATRIACAALTGGTDTVANIAAGVGDYVIGEIIADAAEVVGTERHWLRAARDSNKVLQATRDFYGAQARFQAISAAIRTGELPAEAVAKLQTVRNGTISKQLKSARALGKSICGAAANVVKEALLRDAIEGLYSATSVRAEMDETLIVHMKSLEGNITTKFNEAVEDVYPKGSGWKGSWQDLFEVMADAKQRRGRAELVNDAIRTITMNGATVRLSPSNDPDASRRTRVPFQHVINMHASRSSLLGTARANRTISGHYSLVPGNATITAPAPAAP